MNQNLLTQFPKRKEYNAHLLELEYELRNLVNES